MILEEQFKNRHLYIGGSDVPIILGCSKFKSPFELLLEKAKLVESDFGGSVYSEIGNLLEGRIQNGMKLVNVDEITYKKTFQNVNFECHIDGLNNEGNQIQEIKVTNQSLEDCYNAYEWQIRCYMYVVGINNARLIQLRRDGKLKHIATNIIRRYKLDFLHNFNHMDNNEVTELVDELKLELDNLYLSTGMLGTKNISHDQKKEDYMLRKVSVFWDFRERLINDNSLRFNPEFKSEFDHIFSTY